MARDQDRSEQFEWVNAWAASTQKNAAPVGAAEPVVESELSPPAPPPLDQLTRDIAAIESARDTLAVPPVGTFSARRRTQTLTLVASRTSDRAPVVIGGILALVMLTVFGAAAAMTKFSR